MLSRLRRRELLVERKLGNQRRLYHHCLQFHLNIRQKMNLIRSLRGGGGGGDARGAGAGAGAGGVSVEGGIVMRYQSPQLPDCQEIAVLLSVATINQIRSGHMYLIRYILLLVIQLQTEMKSFDY